MPPMPVPPMPHAAHVAAAEAAAAAVTAATSSATAVGHGRTRREGPSITERQDHRHHRKTGRRVAPAW